LQRIQPMAQTAASNTAQSRAGWRLRLGLIILVVGFLSPLAIPLITATELSSKWKAVISGALAVGIPEVFSVVAIAIIGKSGYNRIKERIFSFLKKHGPPDRVSPTRYRIGLVMFVLPIIFGWLGPYGARHIPGYAAHQLAVSLIIDIIFFASLFLLGGDFWDKLRALFIHGASVQLDSKV
jgi:hypothetical protein